MPVKVDFYDRLFFYNKGNKKGSVVRFVFWAHFSVNFIWWECISCVTSKFQMSGTTFQFPSYGINCKDIYKQILFVTVLSVPFTLLGWGGGVRWVQKIKFLTFPKLVQQNLNFSWIEHCLSHLIYKSCIPHSNFLICPIRHFSWTSGTLIIPA